MSKPITHNALPITSDNNACTNDTCDTTTGNPVYTATTPNGQCCTPGTGALAAIDDNNACTCTATAPSPACA